MNWIGGLYNVDGAPVDPGLLSSLQAKLSQRWPNEMDTCVSGPLMMMCSSFCTRRDSCLEKQPAVSARGQILCWDGRLDNRDELRRTLGEGQANSRSEAAIALDCYKRWGIKFVSLLVGDYAVCVWDPQTNSLLLARDPVGTRTLFYHATRKRISWSSDIEGLISILNIRLEVDDEYVAGFLAFEPDPALSPYKSIRSVPPGNTLTVTDATFRVQEFWRLDPRHHIRYRTDAEYEEHFRHLFRDAVRCRLQVNGSVLAELSGGLDSSSIVCMSDEILAAGNATASSLETVSFVYNASSSDERRFIKSVEEKRGRPGIHLLEDEYWLLPPDPTECPASIPTPEDCCPERRRQLQKAMRDVGAQVLLSGHGGDHLLWSEAEASPELADLASKFKLIQLHHRISSFCKVEKQTYVNLLWRGAFLPMLPRRLRANFEFTEIPSWIDQRFMARVNFRDLLLGPPAESAFSLPSAREHCAMVRSAIWGTSAGYYQQRNIEVRFPFLHRPLIEFCVSIPMEQKLRPAETRSIQRRALRNLLPAIILNRRSKRGPEEVFIRALRRRWPYLSEIFADARVCAWGYAEPRALGEALKRARHGAELHTFRLMRTIALEFWLRAVERRLSMCHGNEDAARRWKAGGSNLRE